MTLNQLLWILNSFVLLCLDLANNGMQLTLRFVNRQDAGIYECTATNGVGHDAKEFIELEILCKDRYFRQFKKSYPKTNFYNSNIINLCCCSSQIFFQFSLKRMNWKKALIRLNFFYVNDAFDNQITNCLWQI